MMMTDVKVSMSKMIGKGYNRFFHDKSFYRVVKGSRGSKKSKTTALCYIHDILKYEWANLLVVRRYSNTNKQSTYTDFKWAASQLKVLDKFKFNESMPEITVKATGQKILFRGLDDELKITSITVDVGVLCWAWFEEAYQIENEAKFATVVESIRGSHDSPDFYKQITVTFNPWNENHWLKVFFFDDKTRYADVFADTTTFRDNEFLDEADKARYLDLYRTNPRRARVVCDGDWGVVEGLVFDNYRVVDFDPVSKIKDIGLTVHGMDFGFTNDPTTLPSSIFDKEKNELWIYNELYEYGMLTQDIYNAIAERNLLKAEITADNQPITIADLQAKGVRRIHRARKGADSIQAGISFMQGLKIYIHPSCVKTMEEFSSYSYKQDRKTGKWLNEPEDKNNHIIDAIRYSLEAYSLQDKRNINDRLNAFKAILG